MLYYMLYLYLIEFYAPVCCLNGNEHTCASILRTYIHMQMHVFMHLYILSIRSCQHTSVQANKHACLYVYTYIDGGRLRV